MLIDEKESYAIKGAGIEVYQTRMSMSVDRFRLFCLFRLFRTLLWSHR